MADYVDQVMQDMVPELDDLRRKRIFKEEEVKQIVRKRREFEYLLQRSPGKPKDFLSYVRYEVALESLRRRRSSALHWKSKSLSDYAGIRRLHTIFNRGVKKFKADMRLWYQYIDFCLRSGSTKALSRVLLRALRFHPREVHLWLLAADRELKLGNFKAARALLLRGLRFSPCNAKLWGEFLRLEISVALHLQKVRDGPSFQAEKGTEVPKESLWKTPQFIFKRALGRLKEHPQACSGFLAGAVRSLGAIEETTREGPSDLISDVRAAIADCRPGIPSAGSAWTDVSPDVASAVWELWWEQERAAETSWQSVVDTVLDAAPSAVLSRLILSVRGDVLKGAISAEAGLLALACAPRVGKDAGAALAVLEALERCIEAEGGKEGSKGDKMASASRKLLRQAAKDHPSCTRLRLHAWRELASNPEGGKTDGSPSESGTQSIVEFLRGARDLSSADAVQLLLLAAASPDDSPLPPLGPLFQALASTTPLGPLVQAYLSSALAHGGHGRFRQSCDHALGAADAQLWAAPRRRAEVIEAVLDSELRVLTVGEAKMAARLCNRFESLLTALDGQAAIDWWVRYVEFAHTLAQRSCRADVPNATDLHWRAMRSVDNQALYLEKTQRLHQMLAG